MRRSNRWFGPIAEVKDGRDQDAFFVRLGCSLARPRNVSMKSPAIDESMRFFKTTMTIVRVPFIECDI